MDRILLHSWEFGKPGKDRKVDEWFPIQVPSDVYIGLQAHGRIPDTSKDLNELSPAVRAVADQEWVYRTKLRTGFDDKLQHDIVFEGLDTHAMVFFDGVHILSTDNMFRTYRVNINGCLAEFLVKAREANNEASDGEESREYTLEIWFDSARRCGQTLIDRHPEHNFLARQSEATRLPVRKAQYHWGWDWGPILPGTSGPWKPVYLERYEVKIDDVWVKQTRLDQAVSQGKFVAKVLGGDYEATERRCTSLEVHWRLWSHSDPGVASKQVRLKNSALTTPYVVKSSVGEDGISACPFDLDQPALWYPRGYGKQCQYEVWADLFTAGNPTRVHRTKKRISFRTVELVQERDEDGKSFYFRINGVDVFAGGSCWIPASNHPSQLSKQQYYDWVKLVAEGNQSMIRVWGGGIYEDDAFYDACDELGILVWQDFAFACGNYPAYPSFRETVEEEARQNVRRLRSHPSLVCWAGNNEDYQVQERFGLDYNYADKDPDSWLKTNFPARWFYEYLFPKIVQEEGPGAGAGAAYHPSSPWGGGRRTDDAAVGDLHQWNIWHGRMEKYQNAGEMGGRFVSEFGLEGYPHAETIEKMITRPGQRYPGSATMDFHNKAIDQSRRLAAYMAENYRAAGRNLRDFIHISQMTQADAVAFAFKAWRRQWGKAGSRRCGGVLVWQLNDCWPAISWSVVDCHMVKKPAYYSIRRALEPLTIGVSRQVYDWTETVLNKDLSVGHVDPTREGREGTRFSVWVANSRDHVVLRARVTVRFISVRTGRDVLARVERVVDVEPNGTTEVLEQRNMPLAGDDDDYGEEDAYVVYARLGIDGRTVATDVAWPQPIKYLDFAGRGLCVSATSEGEGGSGEGEGKRTSSSNKVVVRIRTERPVKGLVFEERVGVCFSDNNLDIMPGEEGEEEEEERVVEVEGVGVGSGTNMRYAFVGEEQQ